MKQELYRKEFFNGTSKEVSEEYDLKDPAQIKPAMIALAAFSLPLLLCVSPAIYIIISQGKIVLPVALIFIGVLGSMILTASALVYNKEHAEEPDEDGIRSAKEIRSIMIIIAACITYLPFVPYVLALGFSKAFPDCSFYSEGFNAQKFTLLWSIISLFAWGIVGFVFFNVL